MKCVNSHHCWVYSEWMFSPRNCLRLDVISRFQSWPAGKMRRIGCRVHPDFSFHTCTMQQEVFCTDAFTTATNPVHYSGERWSSRVEQTEAEGNVLTPLRRSQDFLNTQTPVSTLITTKSLDIFVCLCSTCVSAFSPGDICFVLVFLIFASDAC